MAQLLPPNQRSDDIHRVSFTNDRSQPHGAEYLAQAFAATPRIKAGSTNLNDDVKLRAVEQEMLDAGEQ